MADSQYFTFALREQQQKIFNELQSFTNQDYTRVFILKGYAGTGKTSIIGGFIKWLNEKKRPFALLASTGRAAKILKDKAQVEARTLHSHIYTFKTLSHDLEQLSEKREKLQADETGQLQLIFSMASATPNETGKVYIIDEASMLSDIDTSKSSQARFGSGNLLQDLFHFDPKGFFIFVGDPCQLPPIGSSFSPALSADYIQKKYNLPAIEHELTEVIRHQADSGILSVSMQLRNLYQAGKTPGWANLPLRQQANITLLSSHSELYEEYIQVIKNTGFEDATLICHSNARCNQLNQIVRESLYGSPKQLRIGDLLMITQNNHIHPLVNGDQVIVLHIGDREFRAGLYFIPVEIQELFSEQTYQLLLVENILKSGMSNLDEKQHKDLFIDFYHRMKNKGIDQKSSEFHRNMITDPYLNALRAVFGYALTCHKTQGGEWSKVYLYMDNKTLGMPKPEIYQWWYTAITRAKEEFYTVDDWFIK